MNKQLISFLIILLVISLGVVSAGNNTAPIEQPTMYISNGPTIQAIEGGDSNISFEDGYKGYCAEWGEHSAEEGQEFYIKDSSTIDNSNYLKAMFLFFYNQTQKDVYATQHMIWKFTDNKQFSRFNQTWYNQIVDTGDKYTIPDAGKIKLNDTHQFSFDFKAFVPFINEFQNFFAYQFLIEQIPDNSTIQINNSTVNNSTTLLPNYQNNDTYVEYNGTYDIDDIKNSDTSTSDKPNIFGIDKKTGANLWLLGCVIIMVVLIIVAHKRT